MELLLIRAPINKGNLIDEFLKTNGLEIYREILILENEIYRSKEEVATIIYKHIPKIIETNTRRRLLHLKRFIFNKIEPFNVNILEQNPQFFSSNDLKIINAHNELRKKTIFKYKVFTEQIFEDQKNIEKHIKLLLESDWFKSALLTANTGLYKSIYQNGLKKTDRKKFTTLLKYLYKSTIMCTPSSLWAGVSPGHWGDKTLSSVNNEKLTLSFEYNIKKIKHEVRDFVKQNIMNIYEDDANTFYFNPTIFEKDSFLYFWKVEENSFSKCRINCDQNLSAVMAYFWNRDFKLSQLEYFIATLQNDENFEFKKFIEQLVKLDLIRIKSEPLFGSLNPFKDIKDVIYKEKGTKLLENRYKGFNVEFREDFEFLSNNNIDKDIVKTNIQLPWGNLTISSNIKKDLIKAMQLYASLHSSFYKKDNLRLSQFKMNFIETYGYDKLVPILHVSFDNNVINTKKHTVKNYRLWEQPKESNSLFNELIKFILDQDLNCEELKISSDDLLKKLDTFQITNEEKLGEIVFQFYETNGINYIIPEMFSSQYGRLSGRFLKYLDDNSQKLLQDQILYSIEDLENTIQTNIHINNDLDGIGFDMPGIRKKIYLYDKGITDNSEGISINQIYIKLNKLNKLFSVHLEDGKEIKLWNASSISPGNNILYQILNFIPQQNENSINGHAKSRIELDRDYQPRISIDNLIISRARYRIDRISIDFLFNNEENDKRIEKLYNFIIEHKIPEECFIYTDINYKAQYIRFHSIYDIYILQKIVKNSEKYIYFEECLPNKKSYWLKDQKNYYNAEVWARI